MALALTAASACICLSFFFLPHSASVVPWKGARLLAVSALRPETEVLSSLDAAGMSNIVSKSRQGIWFSDFDEWDVVSVAELDRRLIEEDPRRDRYINGIAGFFTARSGERAFNLYYLLGNGSSKSVLEKRIKKALASVDDWLLVEDGSKKGGMEGFAVWLLLLAVLAFMEPKRCFSVCVSFLPWIGVFLSSWVFILACLPALFFMHCLTLLSKTYPYEKRYRVSFFFSLLRNEFGLPLLTCLGASGLLGFVLFPISYACCLIAALGLFSFGEMIEKEKKRRSIHPLFQPVSIRQSVAIRRIREIRPRTLLFYLGVALVLSALALFAPSARGTDQSWNGLLSFPYPHGYTGQTAAEAKLPNYRDYLEHLDYQAEFLEADLSGAVLSRPFLGFSRKEDGSLKEGDARAFRLNLGEIKRGEGIETILRQAGEKALILNEVWHNNGSMGSTASWPLPFLMAGMAFACVACFLRTTARRNRKAQDTDLRLDSTHR
jgi:hypothetical protein